jgi:hypothetical protein
MAEREPPRPLLPLCLALLGGCSRGAPPAALTIDDAASPPPSAVASTLTPASSAPAAASSPPAASHDPTSPPHHPHDAPVCGRTERIFFECHVRDHGAPAIARICGPAGGPSSARYVAFLYGTPARTETEIVVPAAFFGDTARYARYTRPRVTMLAAGFADGATRVELTQADVDDIQPAEHTAELVRRDGDEETRLPCAPLPKQSLIALEEWFPPPAEPWVGGPLW